MNVILLRRNYVGQKIKQYLLILKLLVELEKTSTDSLRMLTNMYETLLIVISQTYIFECHKRFREGRNEVKTNA